MSNEILDMSIRITLGVIAGVGLAILVVKLGKALIRNWGIKETSRIERWSPWAGLIFLLLVVILFVLVRNN
jgi:hypothetical protein